MRHCRDSHAILCFQVRMTILIDSSSLNYLIMSKDAQVIDAILKEMSVTDYEPRVVHQLMEFSNRYVTSLLQEAHVFSAYAKKSSIDIDDIQLAVNMQTDKTVTSPPPKELLLEVAREKNNQPLPPIKPHNGLRIPFDRYTLIGTNYRLKPQNPKSQDEEEKPTDQ